MAIERVYLRTVVGIIEIVDGLRLLLSEIQRKYVDNVLSGKKDEELERELGLEKSAVEKIRQEVGMLLTISMMVDNALNPYPKKAINVLTLIKEMEINEKDWTPKHSELLKIAIACLKPEQREILLLMYLKKASSVPSCKNIGQDMDPKLNKNEVNYHKNRALETLRAIFLSLKNTELAALPEKLKPGSRNIEGCVTLIRKLTSNAEGWTSQDSDKLKGAIEGLGNSDSVAREALELMYLNSTGRVFSSAEVAEILGIEKNECTSKIHNAISNIRKYLNVKKEAQKK